MRGLAKFVRLERFRWLSWHAGGLLSIDTNLLLHAFNEDSPVHEAAYAWMQSIQGLEEVVISEFILAELYGLLRNSAVLKHPLSAVEAVEVIEIYRYHPRWRLIGH